MLPQSDPHEVYARCPACGVIGPPAGAAWDGDSPVPSWRRGPVDVLCRSCRKWHAVAKDQVLPNDGEQDCPCGTVTACPAVADLVRCVGCAGITRRIRPDS